MRTGFSDAVGMLYLVNEEIAVAVPPVGGVDRRFRTGRYIESDYPPPSAAARLSGIWSG